MKKFQYIIMGLAIAFVGCNNSKSEKAFNNTENNEEISHGEWQHDKTKWTFFEGDNHSISMSYDSDNYYVINGRKIILHYSFCYLPFVNTEDPYASFFNLMEGKIEDEVSNITPSFSLEYNENLYIHWEDGTVDVVKPYEVSRNSIMFINHMAKELQEKINKKKKFIIDIVISTGQNYRYYFDFSNLLPLDNL